MSDIREIIGNTTTTPVAQSDWAQNDSTKADYIKNKPTIPTKLSQLAGDSANRTVTDAEKIEWNNKASEDHDHDDLYVKKDELNSAVSGVLNLAQEAGDSETRAMSQKAVTDFVRNSIGIQVDYTTVSSIDEMTDTSKQYVLDITGTVWAYGETTVDSTDMNMFDAGEVALNKLPDGTDIVGSFSTGFIPTNISSAEQYGYTITIKGSLAVIASNSSNKAGVYKIHFYDASYNSISGDVATSAQKYVQADGTTITINIGTNSGGTGAHSNLGSNYSKIAYIKILFLIYGSGMAKSVTAADVPSDLVITTCEPKIGTGMAWYDTGMAPKSVSCTDLLIKINENASNILEITDNMSEIEDRVNNIAVSDNTVELPSYWEESVNSAINKIKDLQNAGGNDVVNFLWFSDFHYGGDKSYTGNVGVLCAAVMDACDIPLTLMNGDTLTASACKSEELALSMIDDAKKIYAPIGDDRLMLVKGNHEDVYGTSGGVSFVNKIAPEKIWNKLFRPQAKDFRRAFGGDGTYFYLDNSPQKVRFICLNGHYYDGDEVIDGTTQAMSFGLGVEQLDWLEDVALTVDDGWGVVVAVHVPPTNHNINGRTNYLTHFGDGGTELRSILTANADKVIALFCGHCHADAVVTDDLPFPIITITCAVNTPYDAEYSTRVPNSTSETALDVVSINRAMKTIYTTRIGYGSDRVVGYGGTQIVMRSVTNTLTNCKNSNSATTVEEGSSYSATITANSGYVLDSVTVTMGGSAVAVTNGVINIPSVTGDIVITATAVEDVVEPTYTNIFDKDKVVLNARFNSSHKVVTQNGMFVTAWYQVPDNFSTDECYLYVKLPAAIDASANSKVAIKTTDGLDTPALDDAAFASLQFNLTTNLGIKWETLDASSFYYKIDLRRNGTGSLHSYLSQIKSFGLAVYVGATALTASTVPDIIMSFEPIE